MFLHFLFKKLKTPFPNWLGGVPDGLVLLYDTRVAVLQRDRDCWGSRLISC